MKMVRVTFVLGCHESRYSQVHKAMSVDQVREAVDTKMLRGYFDIEIVGGFIRIYPSQVSAIEVRELTEKESQHIESTSALVKVATQKEGV